MFCFFKIQKILLEILYSNVHGKDHHRWLIPKWVLMGIITKVLMIWIVNETTSPPLLWRWSRIPGGAQYTQNVRASKGSRHELHNPSYSTAAATRPSWTNRHDTKQELTRPKNIEFALKWKRGMILLLLCNTQNKSTMRAACRLHHFHFMTAPGDIFPETNRGRKTVQRFLASH